MNKGQQVIAAPLAWGFTRTNPSDPTKKKSVALQVEFIVTRGPDEGATLTGKFWFTPGAIERTREQLKHMGWPGGAIATSSGRCAVQLDTRREVKVTVEEDVYNGRSYLKAGFVNPLFRGEIFDGDDLKAFSEELASTVEGFAPRERAPKGASVPADEGPTLENGDDAGLPADPGEKRDAKGGGDDIPF